MVYQKAKGDEKMGNDNIFATVKKDIIEILNEEQLKNPTLKDEYKDSVLGVQYGTHRDGHSYLSIGSSSPRQEGILNAYTIRLYVRTEEDSLILNQIFLFVPQQGTGTKICNLLIDLAKRNNFKQFRIHDVTEEGSKALCKSLKMLQDGDTNHFYLDLE